jgi:hypothetical protein
LKETSEIRKENEQQTPRSTDTKQKERQQAQHLEPK